MSSTDNFDKPGDSQAPTEGVIIQLLPDASLNQSDSPSAPERNEIAEAVEDLDSGGNSKKRKTASLCQICQANLKIEKPYYQVRTRLSIKRRSRFLIIQTYIAHLTYHLTFLSPCSGTEFAQRAHL